MTKPMSIINKLQRIRDNYDNRRTSISLRKYLITKLNQQIGIQQLLNGRKLLKCKDIHSGKRGFVIGNGPSLLMDDLTKLKDEITIASNKIFLAYDKTVWRPTYYSIIDGIVAENISKEVFKIDAPKFFIRGLEGIYKNCQKSMFCKPLSDWFSVDNFKPGFSSDIITGIYPGESVTYWNIQILWYLGIHEIYLLGVDHSFTVPEKRIADAGYEYILCGEGEQNHFDPNYRPPGEKWTMPHLKEQEMSYAFARDYIENKGGVIKNASRKTKLSCLEFIDFDALFLKHKWKVL